MSAETYLVIGALVGILCLLVGGRAAVDGADTTGDLALLSAVVVVGGVVGGAMWPLTLLIGAFWGSLLLFRNAAEKRDQEEFYPQAAESDADKYRRMAREERDLARLHRGTPELAKMHDQLAQQYDGMADIYSG